MTTEERKIIHDNNGYYVTNEGTKSAPKYYVWVPSQTHAHSDSAYYIDLSIAIARCNYLAKMSRK